MKTRQPTTDFYVFIDGQPRVFDWSHRSLLKVSKETLALEVVHAYKMYPNPDESEEDQEVIFQAILCALCKETKHDLALKLIIFQRERGELLDVLVKAKLLERGKSS
ncbi:MAG: hypothetical protein WC617_05165 [Rhodanobacter sp.]|jgi:hypothetical protein